MMVRISFFDQTCSKLLTQNIFSKNEKYFPKYLVNSEIILEREREREIITRHIIP